MIPKKWFILLTCLFVLMPFSVQWRYFFFGQKTKASVVDYIEDSNGGVTTTLYTILGYYADSIYYETHSNEYIRFEKDRNINIIYNKQKPEKCIILTPSGLLLSYKMVLPFMILLLWFAFYFSFKKKKNKYPDIQK